MSVVIVGKNSFLAQGLEKNPLCKDWSFLSHTDILGQERRLREASLVINFAFAPEMTARPYDPSHDIDLRLAKIIQRSDTRYIMLSTRMVYGPAGRQDYILSENDACLPVSPYGKNKKEIEDTLLAFLGTERLCILRLANVFGDEAGRKTFFGTALKNLRDRGHMEFDIAPSSVRDFLPISIFQDWLIKIALNFRGGVYNLGSGLGISCGEITRWMIEGYGTGDVDFISDKCIGDFVLSMDKTRSVYELSILSKENIAHACRQCGQNLRSA